MKKHPITIDKYNGSFKELANDIADLRYDVLEDFLYELHNSLMEYSIKDKESGKHQLAIEGKYLAERIRLASVSASRCLKISKPYMKEDIRQRTYTIMSKK